MTHFSADTKYNFLAWFTSILCTTLSKLAMRKKTGEGVIFAPKLEEKGKAEGMTYNSKSLSRMRFLKH